MNNDWLFWIESRTEAIKVRLPHTMVELPLNHVSEASYQVVGHYEKRLPYSEAFDGKRVFVRFEAIAHVARVYLNDQLLVTHYGGYSAFKVELTEQLRPGDNVLYVLVSAMESENLPPFGGVVDYLAPGGIYRKVGLIVRERSYLKDFYLYPFAVLEQPRLHFSATIEGDQAQHRLIIEQLVSDVWHPVCDRPVSDTIEEEFWPYEAKLWSPEDPVLYRFRISLDEQVEEVRIGFREALFTPDGFYLNGQKRPLIGLNRHQSYPYIGYAAPRSLQRLDAKILKEELCLDVVRTSHYPQSRHFLEACDELGLFVITETPGWQHIGDRQWQARSLQMTREMVVELRHHPSIILWGTRINESADHEAFYTQAHTAAKAADPIRQTTGVRAHRHSQLLEEVYGYNDFSHSGVSPGLLDKSEVCGDVPYFIAEHSGHMFPVKSFDHESLRLAQLKRHARVIDAYYTKPGISGVIGWCLADYYTHQDFGSGDSICYHGVLDAFRIKKPAAALYAVRRDEPVLEVMGNLSIGEYPAILMKEIVVMSNQPAVEVYKNDRLIATLSPDRQRFSGLPCPPLILDDLFGDQLAEVGYDGAEAELIKQAAYQIVEQGGLEATLAAEVVPLLESRGHKLSDLGGFYTKYVGNWGDRAAEYVFRAGELSVRSDRAHRPRLLIDVSHQELIEYQSYDMALVRIEAIDDSGSRLPYLQASFLLETSGAIELVGPRMVSLAGGAIGILVRSDGTGPGRLLIKSDRLGETELAFMVRTENMATIS